MSPLTSQRKLKMYFENGDFRGCYRLVKNIILFSC